MQKKLFLLDAMALIFRAYYALVRNPRVTSRGKNTNAQFGFTNTLMDLINNQKPTHMAVCFEGGVSDRVADFADYKANRQEAPEDITAATPDIRRLLAALNIPQLDSKGFEADDVIGTLAKKAEAAGYEVYMVTPDKDYGQLVSERVKIYKPGYQGGPAEILGPEEVCAKWEIDNVAQVIDMLGLMGDAIDNIPGVAGIGQKTAAKLIKEWGSLEAAVEAGPGIKGALGQKLVAGRDSAIMSKKLATIVTQVPVEFHEEEFRLKEMNRDALREILTELEFRSVAKRLLGEELGGEGATGSANRATVAQGLLFDGPDDRTGPAAPFQPHPQPLSEGEGSAEQNESNSIGGHVPLSFGEGLGVRRITNTPHNYELVESDGEIESLVNSLLPITEISFDTETTGIDANIAELVGLSFSIKKGEGWYVPLPARREEADRILQKFQPLFDEESKLWIGHNLKYDLLVLRWYGIVPRGQRFDTLLAHYVIEPEGKHNMDALSLKYLHYEPVHIEELIGKKGKGQGTMRDVPIDRVKEYAVEDTDVTLQFKGVFEPLLKKYEVEEVFRRAEIPLGPVLVDMEYQGVRIDMDFLNAYSAVLEKEALEHEDKVYAIAGSTFNLGSPKQLGEVLFDKLKLDPGAKKTRTGQYATGEDVLSKLAKEHPIADHILAYREYTKLRSTYVDALPLLVHPKSGRVHTTFAQAVAVTGRLSSNNPNLQNIPIRTDRGREIRKAFIPRDADHVLVSADYSQIELRIVAALSADPAMCEAFLSGKDVHTATAAKVYGIPIEEVTSDQRRKAKTVNFGIIYGQSAFGLSETLRIPRAEARDIIEAYKKEFAGISAFMDGTLNFCREHGYVQTILGRKRWLRDINSANFTVRGLAERNAINSPIQGTAADMIKLAMVNVYGALQEGGFKSKMVLQVHDELVFDVCRDELERIQPVILEGMQTAMELPNGIPILAEIGHGENWLEAH